jgi:hypothetical protein
MAYDTVKYQQLLHPGSSGSGSAGLPAGGTEMPTKYLPSECR